MIGCGVFYFFNLSGKLLLSLLDIESLQQKRYAHTFLSVILGWILLISLYAIVKTSGQTVLLVLIIPFIVLFYSAKKRSRSITDYFKWESGWWMLVVIVFVTIQFLQLVKVGGQSEFPFYIQNWDYSYYANFIEALQKTGIENTHGPAMFFEKNIQGTTPYHYADIWTGAFFSELTGFMPVISLRLFVYSFFELLFFLGLLSIWELYKTVGLKEIILSFLLMLVGGMFFEVYEYIPFMGTAKYLSDNHLLGYGNVKYGPLYVLVVSVFLLYKYQYKKASFVVWTLLPVFFISVLPAIIGGCVLFGLYQVWIERKRISHFYWIMPLVVYSALGVFYILTSSNDNSSVSSSNELLLVFVSGLPFQTAIGILLKKLLVCFVLFPAKYVLSVLPWICWIVWQSGWGEVKEDIIKYKSELLLVFFSLLSGLFAFWLWYVNVDAQQLFNNLAFPAVNVLIIVLMVRLWVNKSITLPGSAVLTILVGYMLINNVLFIQKETAQYNDKYSGEYLSAVMKLSKKIPGSGGVFLAGENYYDTSSVFTYKPTQHIEGYYLPLMNVHTPFTLSVFDMPILKKEEEKVNQVRFKHSSYFYRYCEVRQVKLQSDFIQNSMLDFIKENHFRYLVVGKGANVPHILEEICETCVMDKLSGERFCVLKAE